MNIVNLISNDKIRDSLNFALESKIHANVMSVQTVPEALELLLNDPRVDVAILEHGPPSQSVLKLIEGLKLSIHFFIWSIEPVTDSAAEKKNPQAALELAGLFSGYLNSKQSIDELVAEIEKVKPPSTSASLEDQAEKVPDADFSRIKFDLFLGKKLSADLYLRLSPNKFVKMYLKGDILTETDQQKISILKSVEYLFVKKGENGPVIVQLNDSIKELLAKNESQDPTDVAKITACVLDSAHTMMVSVGLTPEIKSLIKSSMMLVVKSATQNPRLRGLITKLSTDRLNYISSHSTLLAQLSCTIAAACDWGSTQTFQKLTMAAFLHDITVKNVKMAETVHNNAELEAAATLYTKEEHLEYKLHPATAAKLVLDFSEIPPDVDTIITQHHEYPDGSGFPRGLKKAQISPLSVLFIVAHDLLNEMYKNPSHFSIDDFIRCREEMYDSGNFKKILQKLSEIQGLSIEPH